MAGQARTRSRSPITALGAALALVLALAGVWTGMAPGALGASDPAGTPFGHFDNAVAVPGGIQVWGWAIDPDTTAPIYVWVTLDGTGRHLYADAPRPDVAAAYPGSGPDHGFAGTLPAPAGTHTVCATASTIGPGTHKPLGCRAITVRTGSPVGNFENARAVNGGVEVKGWAIDPDTTAPIYVWVTLDGVGRHLYANRTRPDVAAAFPAYGAAHGFTGTLTAPAGIHTVCVTASNVGPGAHSPFGCRTVTVIPAGSPFGNFEEAHGVVGGIEIKGWAIDPDTTDPIYVWVTIDGVGRHLFANRTRPDVAAAYPAYGPNHGFTGTLTTLEGTHTVCVTASNVGPGAHRTLGCRTVTTPPGPTMTVTLYFNNPAMNPGMLDCSLVFPVQRVVPASSDVVAAAMEALLAGPTPAEAGNGYTSLFSQATAGTLIRVQVSNDTAYVDLEDVSQILGNASTSCGSAQYVTEMSTTVTHAAGVSRALFAFDGDPAAFWEFLQIGCGEWNDYCDPTPFQPQTP